MPFFGRMGLSEITCGTVQEYRMQRLEKAVAKRGKPPARNTAHQEIVTRRQTLKTAIRHEWLDRLPDLSEPYRASAKISHRAWFSPDEYKQLYEATRKRARNRLQVHDVTIVEDDASQETILEIEVRGKRGVGYCKSTDRRGEAVRKAQGKKRREDEGGGEGAASDRSHLPKTHRELFNTILEEEKLKTDREGLPRTAYSLRHTYICLRLMEGGADIYQIAKNCRTSVEMIEKYCASHIKTNLGAAAINIRKKKPPKKTETAQRHDSED